MSENNKELIELKLSGENHIDLDILSGFFPMISSIILETSPNDDIDAKVLPFEKGSFTIFLDIINNPIVTTLVFPTIATFIGIKIEAGRKKGNYKATRRTDNKDMYDVLFDDGTTRENVPRHVIKLLKDNRLNKQSKVFIDNYLKENRGDLKISELKTGNEVLFAPTELKEMSKSTTISTITESIKTERIWVEVISWGYVEGKWGLKPLKPLKLTNSKAKIEATVRNLDTLSKYIIEDNVHMAHKYIEIELGIEYKEDIISDKISGQPTYFIDEIYESLNNPK